MRAESDGQENSPTRWLCISGKGLEEERRSEVTAHYPGFLAGLETRPKTRP